MVFRHLPTLLVIAASPAAAQSTMPPEFTAECGECTYKLTFDSPDATGVQYELALPDPSQLDGRRRVYKGASTSAFVTIRGAQNASLRACYHPSNCSGWTEMTLIPPPDAEGKQSPLFSNRPAISLLHPVDASQPVPRDLAVVTKGRPVLMDLSATGQRACTGGTGTRQWNLGTRMLLSLSSELEFKVVNRELIEHRDGRWTWIGDIEGTHSGTVTLTADDCEETAYVSIRSDVGGFAIRPVDAPLHVTYEVDESTDTRERCASANGTATPILDVAMPTDGSSGAGRVEIDAARLHDLVGALPYLAGDDRNHDLADFFNPLLSVELVSGEPAVFDLRDGTISLSASGDMYWSGCLAGEPDSRMMLSVTASDREIHVAQVRDGRHVSLRKTGSGYRIDTEMLEPRTGFD